MINEQKANNILNNYNPSTIIKTRFKKGGIAYTYIINSVSYLPTKDFLMIMHKCLMESEHPFGPWSSCKEV